MSPATATLLTLAAATYALKAAGPLVLGGGRGLPPVLERLSTLLPVPLLAAMAATSTLVDGSAIVVDARLAGVAAAAVALWRRLPFVAVVAVAATTTAAVRALT